MDERDEYKRVKATCTARFWTALIWKNWVAQAVTQPGTKSLF